MYILEASRRKVYIAMGTHTRVVELKKQASSMSELGFQPTIWSPLEILAKMRSRLQHSQNMALPHANNTVCAERAPRPRGISRQIQTSYPPLGLIPIDLISLRADSTHRPSLLLPTTTCCAFINVIGCWLWGQRESEILRNGSQRWCV